MTSWFNLIVSNRIIHGNKLPKWGYTLPKSFNNDGNHGHDVSQYYFITGFSLCICRLGRASGWAQLASRLTHSCWRLTETHTAGSRGEGQRPHPPAATDAGLLPNYNPFGGSLRSKESRRTRFSHVFCPPFVAAAPASVHSDVEPLQRRRGLI